MKKLLITPIIVIALFLLGVGVAFGVIFIGGSGRTDEVNLQKGLVAHWTLDGHAKDSTPYGNNGTVYGASSTADRKGKANGALSFDGVDDYVEVDYDTGNMVGLNPDHISVEVWIYPRTISSDGEAFAHGGGDNVISKVGLTNYQEDTSETDDALRLALGADDEVGFYIDDGADHELHTDSVLILNDWQHIVAIYNGSEMKIYVNDSLEASFSFTESKIVDCTNPVTMGSPVGWGGGSSGIDGLIDEARIYNRALSVDEVRALYESYDPAPRISDLQKGLVGHWTLDGHAKDSTPYGNNGTIYEASSAADRKGKANGALSFDGSDDYVDVGIAGLSTYLVSFWTYPDSSSPSDQYWITDVGNAEGGFYLKDVDTDQVGYRDNEDGTRYPWDGTGNTTEVTFASIADGWHHLVFYSNGTDIHLILDGVDKGYITPDLSTKMTTNYLGSDRGNNHPLGGILDEVRIYNRALSAEEIKQLYESYDPAPRISDLQKGLVGHWTLDGHAKDSTPYGNNGTIYGASLTADRKGKTNGALSFDGEDDYVRVEDSVGLEIDGEITVSLWVKIRTLGETISILSKGENDGTGVEYRMGIGHEATDTFDFGYADGGWHRAGAGGTVLSTDTWYHLVGIYDGSNYLTYVNGELDDSYADTVAPASDVNWLSIGNASEATQYIDGSIDELRIYNRALSADEVKALYESYQ